MFAVRNAKPGNFHVNVVKGAEMSAAELARQVDFWTDRPDETVTWADLAGRMRSTAERAYEIYRGARDHLKATH